MKKYILILAGCLCISLIANAGAQFENQVSKTVNKVTKNNDTQNDNSSANSGGDQYTANFAKYKISSVPAYNKSDIKFSYWGWMSQYSHYEIKNNTVVGRAIVYGSEKHDEVGTFLGNSVAYIFENGKLVKKTSMNAIENQKKPLEAAYSKYDWPYDSDSDIGNYMSYNSGAAGQQAYVNFNGKQYGPYMMISGINVNKDKTKFLAIGAKMNMNSGDLAYYLFSSNGKEVKLPSMPAGILFNIDFSHGGATGFMNANSDDAPSASNMDYHDIYFADGTVRKNVSGLGPSVTAWLDPSGKNILAVDQNSAGWLNGKKVAKSGASAGNIWCSSDGARWCYTYTDSKEIAHLLFSDGADIRGFLHPQQLVIGSKTYIAWFQYKDVTGQVLLFCTKEL